MLLLAGLKNQLKQKKTRRIHREKVEQAAGDTVAGLTAAANAVVLLSTWSIMTGAETRWPTLNSTRTSTWRGCLRTPKFSQYKPLSVEPMQTVMLQVQTFKVCIIFSCHSLLCLQA